MRTRLTFVAVTMAIVAGCATERGIDVHGPVEIRYNIARQPDKRIRTRIHNHTNRYTCKFIKGESGTASNKVPEDTALKFADPQN